MKTDDGEGVCVLTDEAVEDVGSSLKYETMCVADACFDNTSSRRSRPPVTCAGCCEIASARIKIKEVGVVMILYIVGGDTPE